MTAVSKSLKPSVFAQGLRRPVAQNQNLPLVDGHYLNGQEKPEWGHGAFTKALIEGLEGGADYDRDNVIDVKELTNGSQHPTTEIPKTMPNFPLVYR
jgi:hypothetical protein